MGDRDWPYPLRLTRARPHARTQISYSLTRNTHLPPVNPPGPPDLRLQSYVGNQSILTLFACRMTQWVTLEGGQRWFD